MSAQEETPKGKKNDLQLPKKNSARNCIHRAESTTSCSTSDYRRRLRASKRCQAALEEEIAKLESTVHDLQSELRKKRPSNLEHELRHSQRRIIDLDSECNELAGDFHDVMEENEENKRTIYELRQETIELREMEKSALSERDRVIEQSFAEEEFQVAIEEMRHQMRSKLLDLQARHKRLKIEAFQRTEERDVYKQLIDNLESARDKENIESYRNAEEMKTLNAHLHRLVQELILSNAALQENFNNSKLKLMALSPSEISPDTNLSQQKYEDDGSIYFPSTYVDMAVCETKTSLAEPKNFPNISNLLPSLLHHQEQYWEPQNKRLESKKKLQQSVNNMQKRYWQKRRKSETLSEHSISEEDFKDDLQLSSIQSLSSNVDDIRSRKDGNERSLENGLDKFATNSKVKTGLATVVSHDERSSVATPSRIMRMFSWKIGKDRTQTDNSQEDLHVSDRSKKPMKHRLSMKRSKKTEDQPRNETQSGDMKHVGVLKVNKPSSNNAPKITKSILKQPKRISIKVSKRRSSQRLVKIRSSSLTKKTNESTSRSPYRRRASLN
eukprot:CAMPEP_0194369522 /NCGR_PEP_ID=MMETSP0174-20130528/17837_1 /TAXON_ID=216777 /ORGANISM="Proboscia alata, Strain PI-D3" /LENGTH=554 /DNA_ID=CAMNT_0039146523 /DNA_START=1 /DNA_END=1665 /DNA_ORIENTATION=-